MADAFDGAPYPRSTALGSGSEGAGEPGCEVSDFGAVQRERPPMGARPVRSAGGALHAVGVLLALATILLAAAYFRLVGVNWDSNTHLHPDERFITMVETAISWPKSVGEYFDTARSPLNPYNRGFNSFVYGTFPLFLVKWLGDALGMAGYDQIHLVGRVVSALFDLGSVFLIFLIGRRLYGTHTGLLAAALSAGAVIQIQQSHFFTFDTFVGFFLLASFLFAVRIWQGGSWYDYPLLGAFLGLAVASKVNSAVFALVVGMVALKQMREVALSWQGHRMEGWLDVAGRFLLSALVALIVFRVVQPYAFTGPGFFDVGVSTKFLGDMLYVQKLVSGEIDQPPSVQWAGTTPYLFPLRNLVLWGMGLPLGVVGWAGLLFAGYRLLKHGESRHLLPVVWVVFFFWYQGGQLAKTMRYFLPIVPLLAMLGAHLLLRAEEAACRRATEALRFRRGWGFARTVVYVLVAVAVVGTLLYAFAFTRIYTRPVTRIAATEWIFDNIPRGTPIANEHWDDPLPLRWKGRDAGWYRGTMLELYNDDTPEKREKLLAQLDQTEYIFLSSNRLYGSIPRMPMRYPMTSEYYRLLFSGELGFRLVKTFTSYPTIFGFQINDDDAEEIFSVYDHPKVLIFRKGPEYSSHRARELLEAVPLDGVLRIKTVQAGRNGLLLSADDWSTQQESGTWSELYDRQGLANRFPTVTWWLALELLGLLALPLAWRVFACLPDRGYGLAKALGILVVAYVAWLLPSLRLLPFGRPPILLGMALLALLALVALRGRWAEFRSFLSTERRLILAQEAVFVAAFGLFWLIRAGNPDLWHLSFGGEKPMEFAYLNAVAKSSYFPPYDPWMAGGYVNYYYFGFVIVATVMRLTGIVPSVAFNLAIPSIFALTAVGLFSFGLNYMLGAKTAGSRASRTGAVLAGIGAAVFVLILGNLDGAVQRVEALWKLGGLQFKSTLPLLEGTARAVAGVGAWFLGGKSLPPFDFWRSTRIIGPENPTPITEFPYFTFLYGDLHPHMMAMPLATVALGLALAAVWSYRGVGPAGNRQIIAILPLSGLVVGALQATNSWDYPTYLLLISAALMLAVVARDGEPTSRGIVQVVLSVGTIYLVAQLLFIPFTRSYELFYNGVDLARGSTSLQHYLVIFGFFLFCFGSVLLHDIWTNRWHRFGWRALWERVSRSPRALRRAELERALVCRSAWMELLPLPVLAVAGAALLAGALGVYLVALLLLVGCLCLLALFARDASPEKLLMVLFVGLGVALTLGVEFVTIKGDIGRMNTVFKFYLQAWFLFGLASAMGVARILWQWRSSGTAWASGWRRAWVLGAGILLAATLIYPVAATPVKVGARFQPTPPTLDGMAYMTSAAFKDQNRDIRLSSDYAAINWLQDRVAGSPVVLEAQIPEYRWGSRVSIYTGLPTVLGWTWHQRQQRWGYQWMIDERLRDIKTMFETADSAVALSLLRKYDVGLIYIGDLERAYYPPTGLAKFDAMVGRDLSVVYQADGVTIYEVRKAGRPSVVLSDEARRRRG